MAKFKPTPSGMDEIRAAIDALDRQIAPLLAERTAWVRSAAQFKETRADVVVPWRIEDVVTKASSHVDALGEDPEPIAHMYRSIVDISIGQEALEWDQVHKEDKDE